MMTHCSDPREAIELLVLRERMRDWRFYDHLRTDRDAPARKPQIGTYTPVLASDGVGPRSGGADHPRDRRRASEFDDAIADAFPGARVDVTGNGAYFEIEMQQHGLLRPLKAAELSDGTLRYLLLVAALLSPRPPALMILNEPETSLHPDLLPSAGAPDRAGGKAVAGDRGLARPDPGRRTRRGGGKQADRAREAARRDHRPGPDPARLDLAVAIDVERPLKAPPLDRDPEKWKPVLMTNRSEVITLGLAQCAVIQARASRWAAAISASRHQLGDLAAQRDRVGAALQRGEIEPFVRGDQIDHAGTAARPVKPALEQHVRDRGRVHRHRCIQIKVSLKHLCVSPFCCWPPSPERGPRPTVKTPVFPTPFAGLLRRSWPIKFEGQFKFAMNAAVNARDRRTAATELRKCLCHRRFRADREFGLPCAFRKTITIARKRAAGTPR